MHGHFADESGHLVGVDQVAQIAHASRERPARTARPLVGADGDATVVTHRFSWDDDGSRQGDGDEVRMAVWLGAVPNMRRYSRLNCDGLR